MASDLAGLYGCDIHTTLANPTPPNLRYIQSLLVRLPLEERSTFNMKHLQDNPAAFGWGTTEQLLAALIDAVNLNTTVTGRTAMQYNDKFPVFDHTPTPFTTSAAVEKKELASAKESAPNKVVDKSKLVPLSQMSLDSFRKN